MTWSTADIPDLSGRRALVTGVTGGLGLATAVELARRGAELVVTARDADRATQALERIAAEAPGAPPRHVVSLDLADLADVRRAAHDTMERFDHLDIMVNNAGIMATPRRTTADGYELQIGTNHLGHFAWTGLLWPLLRDSDARIVSVSSIAHTRAQSIDLRSLTPKGSPRRYFRWTSYAESKLANLSFAVELDRRIKASGLGAVSVAAHPGAASTNLTRTGAGLSRNPLSGIAMHQITRIFAQSATAGAMPLLMAATDPTLTGGEYIGPAGLGGTRGRPVLARSSRASRDPTLGEALWAVSEVATGVMFAI